MSKENKRKFNKNFKFNVVLESFISGNAAATAARHDIHISQLNNWRKQLKTQGPEIFEFRKSNKTNEQREIEQLQNIIGKITIENHILKKQKNC